MATFIEHDRQSIRLPFYDYSSPGAYFVTICAYERQELFGKIKNDEMFLNEYGEIITEEWRKTHFVRPYVSLDECVVMPNHFHGIIWIRDEFDAGRMDVFCRGTEPGRGTARRAPTDVTIERFGQPTRHSIPTIIRSFKSAATKRIHEIQKYPRPIWQRNYHERIIRSDSELFAVRRYIKNNPARWAEDAENLHEKAEPK